MESGQERMLVIDTCGEAAAVGLSQGASMVAVRQLPERSASATVVSAMRELLSQTGWTLGDLHGVGVVAGPGSFTGVRTGMAAAKGVCEALGLPLATISRLEVLAEASGLTAGYALLAAGRDAVYVRALPAGNEFLSSLAPMRQIAAGSSVVVAELQLADKLERVLLQQIGLQDGLPGLLRSLRSGGVDAAAAEANYVRAEADIYRQAGA
jgi:tRNA threonylcarbamoyladenosine biosynthesis protein TsaB